MNVGALNTYLASLQKAGLLLFFNPIKRKKIRSGFTVLCGEFEISNDLDIDNSVENFLRDIIHGNYSIILLNGSLIQISYTVESERITGHRYCYIPSPFKFVKPPQVNNFATVVRNKIDDNETINLSSRIRFDFNHGDKIKSHAESHLTFNSQNCRIPVRGGIGIRRFMRFVFLNFVDPELVNRYPDFFKLEKDYESVLSKEFSQEIHMTWGV